ncbi:MAG: hypothetical protein ACR2ND_12390 [Solirubrobacteraceae bacterium]
MTADRVIVTDHVLPALAANTGVTYTRVPQPGDDTLILARELLGRPELPDEHGPWQHAAPGGERTVRLEPAR